MYFFHYYLLHFGWFFMCLFYLWKLESGFHSVEALAFTPARQLAQIKGIGEKKLLAIKVLTSQSLFHQYKLTMSFNFVV